MFRSLIDFNTSFSGETLSAALHPKKNRLIKNVNESRFSQKKAMHKKDRNAFSIGVLGAKGGSGVSTLALNLALSISGDGFDSTLVDANFQQPDIAVLLGKQAEHSLLDFVSRSTDETVFEACALSLNEFIQKDAGTCYFMSGPQNGEAVLAANLSQLVTALESLKKNNDYIVFDLPNNLDRHLITLLDRLDLILLVFEPRLAALAACRRWINNFSDLGYSKEKYQLVLNRSGSKSNELEQELPHLLPGHEVFKIANSFKVLEQCNNEAQVAVSRHPRDKYCQNIKELAGLIEAAGQKQAGEHNE